MIAFAKRSFAANGARGRFFVGRMRPQPNRMECSWQFGSRDSKPLQGIGGDAPKVLRKEAGKMALEKMNREARGGIFGNRLLWDMAICMEPSIAGAKREL